MPIYEDEATTREDLDKIRRKSKCKICGSRLALFWDMNEHKTYLACNPDQSHESIEREASRYQKEGLASLNINTRRETMVKEYGVAKTKALEKYMGVVSLTKPQAKEILVAVFPDAPGQEIARAVMLCASYGLNPLMKHVFLIPFNKGKPNESWATVIGIKAKRLLASRRGIYSYVDDTPRIMTEEEQLRVFGEVYNDKIMVITKVKDPATGAEAPGYGVWPKASEPYGTEKGNSKFNMAAIRSESQALDRLRPGEMPVGVEVAPEEFVEGEFTVKEEPTREEVKQYMEERKEAKADSKPFYEREGAELEPEETKGFIDMDFDPTILLSELKEVKWKDDTVKSYLRNIYKVDTSGTVVEIVARLTREQREAFFKEIQDRVSFPFGVGMSNKHQGVNEL